ncbi:MAG: tRNA lysidine(34) synthetase TilS [Firmicutes bacterium]|nr:tRNA lysidine(34) synthetase TilS [Bacillota bacterium]
MTKAEERVKKTIAERDLIPEGSAVLLGLSAGPDSLCLLHILYGLREKLDFELYALHVNHMLRGADADADEAFAGEYCESLGIPVRTLRCDVKAMAKEQGLSPEDAGRRVRAKALREYADELSEGGRPVLIALAHNRDDQAETVLMRLIRGTGVHGLAAMEYKRKDGVIRPLLDTPRSDIEDYCREKGLKPRIDKTNAEADYTRNSVRLKLLPLLESEYNPRIKEALVRLSSFASEDDACLREEAGSFIKENAKARTESVAFETKALKTLQPAILKRVLALSLADLGLTEDLSAERIAAVTGALNSGRGGLTIELPRGYTAKILKGRLILAGPAGKE